MGEENSDWNSFFFPRNTFLHLTGKGKSGTGLRTPNTQRDPPNHTIQPIGNGRGLGRNLNQNGISEKIRIVQTSCLFPPDCLA